MHKTTVPYNLSVSRFASSPEGLAALSDPNLLELVQNFSQTTGRPEDTFREGKAEGVCHWVGSDTDGEVWSVATNSGLNVAIKLATHTTGKDRWHSGVEAAPSDMFGQAMFMNHFADKLENGAAEHGVHAPKQFFALRTVRGDFLVAMQHMTNMQSIRSYVSTYKPSPEIQTALYTVVKTRLAKVIGGMSILVRAGTSGLGIRGNGDIHDSNVLIPDEADFDPNTISICVLDQPEPSILGYFACHCATALRHFEPQPKEHDPALLNGKNSSSVNSIV